METVIRVPAGLRSILTSFLDPAFLYNVLVTHGGLSSQLPPVAVTLEGRLMRQRK